MDKYAYEPDREKDLIKKASEDGVCPKCGAKTEGQPPVCPACGSEPFEKQEEKDGE